MKKMYYAICALLLCSILSTAIILILSPDVIPAHYNAHGQVDRFGSKYEGLIWPGYSFGLVAIFLLMQRYQKKKNTPELEQKVLLGAAILSLVLFLVLQIIFGIVGIRYEGDSVKIRPDTVIALVNVGTGVLLMVFGNIMPKARRNAFFGLRTKWSMASDDVWRKSQRFGGISAVASGLLLVILAVVFPGTANLIGMTVIVSLWAVAGVVASYGFWKAETRKGNS